MLTTWKVITKYTGFSRNTIKRLTKDEGFPIAFVAGRPTTTKSQIEIWISKKIDGDAQKKQKK